jgi:hypothetical protein
MKLMIATPAYAGNVTIPYLLSFNHTVILLASHNIQVQPLITASGSLLVAERNRLVQAFWESDCTHLLCIDADLGWAHQAVLAMLETKKEFVAGCYPARGKVREFLFRPVKNELGAIVQDETHPHLLKMEYVPAGFMLIARGVIEKMRNKHPDLYYKPKDPRNKEDSGYCFFNTEVWEDEFWGEDYTFCRKAREAGVEIWADPLIQFDHAGTVGALYELLQQQPTQLEPQTTLSEAA